MITREEYIAGARERGIAEETINRVLTKKQFKTYSQPLEAKINDATGIFDIPLVGGLARSLVSSTENYGRMVGGAGYEAGRNPILQGSTKAVESNTQALMDLNKRIQAEKDPVKKQALVEESRRISGQSSGLRQGLTAASSENPLLSESDLRTFSEDPTEGLKRTGSMMLTAATVGNPVGLAKGGAKVLSAPLHPLRSMGQARSAVLGSKSIASSELDDVVRQIYQSSNYKYAPGLTQKAVQSQASKLRVGLNPMQTAERGGLEVITQPSKIPMNTVYEAIQRLEQGARAYSSGGEAGATAIGQGTNIISHAVREYLKGQSPATAKILTEGMKTGYGIQRNKNLIGKAILYAIGAILVGKAANSVTSKLGGE